MGSLGDWKHGLPLLIEHSVDPSRHSVAQAAPDRLPISGPFRVRDVKVADSKKFVPNDTELDGETLRLAIITGPNMVLWPWIVVDRLDPEELEETGQSKPGVRDCYHPSP